MLPRSAPWCPHHGYGLVLHSRLIGSKEKRGREHALRFRGPGSRPLHLRAYNIMTLSETDHEAASHSQSPDESENEEDDSGEPGDYPDMDAKSGDGGGPGRAGESATTATSTPKRSAANSKDPNRPRRKKARRACFACQRAHLTCGTLVLLLLPIAFLVASCPALQFCSPSASGFRYDSSLLPLCLNR